MKTKIDWQVINVLENSYLLFSKDIVDRTYCETGNGLIAIYDSN